MMEKVRQFVAADYWRRDLEGEFLPIQVGDWTITRLPADEAKGEDQLVVSLKWHAEKQVVEPLEGWFHLRDYGLGKDFTVSNEKISKGSFRQELGNKCGIRIGNPCGEYRIRKGDRCVTDGELTPIADTLYRVSKATYYFVRYQTTARCDYHAVTEGITPGAVIVNCMGIREKLKAEKGGRHHATRTRKTH